MGREGTHLGALLEVQAEDAALELLREVGMAEPELAGREAADGKDVVDEAAGIAAADVCGRKKGQEKGVG